MVCCMACNVLRVNGFPINASETTHTHTHAHTSFVLTTFLLLWQIPKNKKRPNLFEGVFFGTPFLRFQDSTVGPRGQKAKKRGSDWGPHSSLWRPTHPHPVTSSFFSPTFYSAWTRTKAWTRGSCDIFQTLTVTWLYIFVPYYQDYLIFHN